MRDIGKAFRRPPVGPLPVRPRDRNGGFPRAFGRGADGVPHGLRCLASPRHALLAENLGKPSLWVNIKDLWYYSAGKRMTKRAPVVLPVPSRRFSAWILPPWASTICLDMLSPRPEWVPNFSVSGRSL